MTSAHRLGLSLVQGSPGRGSAVLGRLLCRELLSMPDSPQGTPGPSLPPTHREAQVAIPEPSRAEQAGARPRRHSSSGHHPTQARRARRCATVVPTGATCPLTGAGTGRQEQGGPIPSFTPGWGDARCPPASLTEVCPAQRYLGARGPARQPPGRRPGAGGGQRRPGCSGPGD